MASTRKKKAKMEDPQAGRSSSSRSVVDNLPNQILMEILSRLPMRTLMAARCVCKSWLLLTSDTEFAKLHSTRAPTELLLQLYNESKFTTDLALGEFEMEKTSVFKVHFDFVFQLPDFKVGPDNDVNFDFTNPISFVNSCHGLLCYCGSFDPFVVIWNPIMGQFITVPEPRREGNIIYCICYGFGFSPKVNKFKLLRMHRVIDPVTGILSSKAIAEVFTIEEGAVWRKIGYCQHYYDTVEMVFVEGEIHWVTEDHNTIDPVIVSFDFDTELFRNVPLPPHLINQSKEDQVKIGVLGGCISLTDFSHTSDIDIWVMKEYGAQDSWSKAFSFAKYSPLYKGGHEFKLIQYLENGEILLHSSSGCLVAYDPANKGYRSIGHAPSRDFKAIAYSPSLFRLEDSMMPDHVYGLDVKLRPVLKIYRSLFICDRADPKKYWRLNEEHLTLRERSEALSRNSKKKITEQLRKEQQKNSRIEQWEEQKKRLEINFVQKPPQQQCSEAPLTNDDIHVPITGEEIHERLSMTGLVQTPASSSATHVTTEVPWEQMKTMVEKLGEELRKERQQRQDFEQRLQNETEHLKQQNQKLEESLQNEEAKVEELKAQIQRSKQENQQMALQLVDEMRAHLAGSL